jgi:hypothetical protein
MYSFLLRNLGYVLVVKFAGTLHVSVYFRRTKPHMAGFPFNFFFTLCGHSTHCTTIHCKSCFHFVGFTTCYTYHTVSLNFLTLTLFCGCYKVCVGFTMKAIRLYMASTILTTGGLCFCLLFFVFIVSPISLTFTVNMCIYLKVIVSWYIELNIALTKPNVKSIYSS